MSKPKIKPPKEAKTKAPIFIILIKIKPTRSPTNTEPTKIAQPTQPVATS
jgi:hypothetical protein